MARRIRRMKRKTVSMKVSEDFYNKIEKARQNFEKKNGISNLKTTAFTGVLANNPEYLFGGKKNVKKYKKK